MKTSFSTLSSTFLLLAAAPLAQAQAHHHHHHEPPAPPAASLPVPPRPDLPQGEPPAAGVAAAAPLAASGPIAGVPIAPPASDKKRLAVLIVPQGDVEPDLAENVTDVLIAAIAKKGMFRFLGSEEFAAKVGASNPQQALACIADTGCLSRAGVALGAELIVAGTVSRQGDDHTIGINLIDISTGQIIGRVYKLVPGGANELIKVIEEGADKLFEPKVAPGSVRVESEVRGAHVYIDDAFIGTAPVRTPDMEAGPHVLRVEAEGHRGFARKISVPAGDTLEIDLDAASLPERPSWPRYVALGGLVASGVLVIGGGAFGELSREAPAGNSRAQVLDSLANRDQEAHIANLLFVGAAAAAVVSVTVLAWHWNDIFGDVQSIDDESNDHAAERRIPGTKHASLGLPEVGVAPAPGGGYVAGFWRF